MSKKFVSLDDDSIGRYFKDIKKEELLTPDEEVELAIRIQNGDEDAVGELVVANLKFVISVAKDYRGQGLTLSDLINDGNEGLIKAALRFDHTRGFRFISYAVWWIKQGIMQSLNENSRMIRLPANIINKMYTLRKELEKFEFENERNAYNGDLSEDNNGLEIMSKLPKCSSLNMKINEDGDELSELIGNDDSDEPSYEVDDKIKDELAKTLEVLDDREKDIVMCRFGIGRDIEPMTLEAIGDRYDLTKERIRQIESKAIRKLRHNANDLFALLNE